MSIADLRKEYCSPGLRREDMKTNPMEQFHLWFQQALSARVNEPNAMTLATADKQGRPSARMVLLKGADERGFAFFTNYESSDGTLFINVHVLRKEVTYVKFQDCL